LLDLLMADDRLARATRADRHDRRRHAGFRGDADGRDRVAGGFLQSVAGLGAGQQSRHTTRSRGRKHSRDGADLGFGSILLELGNQAPAHFEAHRVDEEVGHP